MITRDNGLSKKKKVYSIIVRQNFSLPVPLADRGNMCQSFWKDLSSADVKIALFVVIGDVDVDTAAGIAGIAPASVHAE